MPVPVSTALAFSTSAGDCMGYDDPIHMHG